MKVADSNTPIQMDAYTRQVRNKEQKSQDVQQKQAGVQASGDKVELSGAAREIQRAVQQIGESGVVNEEKVKEVKTQVEAGTYKVVGARAATGMLKESFENDLILRKINTRV